MNFYSENGAMDFQEFETVEEEGEDGEVRVYQLEKWSDSRNRLQDLADSLVEGNGLDVSDYLIRKKQGFYALYIR